MKEARYFAYGINFVSESEKKEFQKLLNIQAAKEGLKIPQVLLKILREYSK